MLPWCHKKHTSSPNESSPNVLDVAYYSELSMLPAGGFAGALEITIPTSIVRQVSVYKTSCSLVYFIVHIGNFWKVTTHVVACIENIKKKTTAQLKQSDLHHPHRNFRGLKFSWISLE